MLAADHLVGYAMSYEISMDIASLPSLPNSLGQFNKWARFNQQKKWATLIARSFIGKCPPTPLVKAYVTITRYSTREPDRDNLFASLKPVLDGLVKNAIIEDDSSEHIILEAKWKKGAPKHGRILLEIRGVTHG